MRFGLALLLLVELTSGAAWAAPPAPTKPLPAALTPHVCKPGAPVAIGATLERGVAHVVVRFERAAAEARVRLHGTDGLAVTRAAASMPTRFDAGADARFDVPCSSAPGGFLVVTVEGVFDGARAQRVVSFRVPGGTTSKAGVITRDSSGRAVQVLPGQTTVR